MNLRGTVWGAESPISLLPAGSPTDSRWAASSTFSPPCSPGKWVPLGRGSSCPSFLSPSPRWTGLSISRLSCEINKAALAPRILGLPPAPSVDQPLV